MAEPIVRTPSAGLPVSPGGHAAALHRGAIRRTMVISVVEGAFTSVFGNWTAGVILTGFMIYLKASPMQLALLASVPLLAQVATPFVAWVEGFAPRRKTLTVATGIIGRSIWILAPLIPFLKLPRSLSAPELVILIVAVSSVFQACNGAIWTAWMGDIVPEDRRGRYFGLRNALIANVVLVATLAAGWFLDSHSAPGSYQVVFLVALVFAGIGIYLYTRQYDPPAQSRPISLAETFARPFRDPNFRRLLKFGVYWQASVFLAAPFVYPYFLEHLKLTFTQVAIWAAIASSLSLLFGPLWGRVADRTGNKAVLAITTFLCGTITPLAWMLATPGHPFFIYVSGVLDPLVWAGLTPAMLNLSLVTAPKQNRAAFIAVLGMATGLAGFVAGAFSGVLLELLHPLEFTVFGYRWSAFHSLIVISMIFRMNAWRFVRPVRETNAWRTRDVLRGILQQSRAWFPWR